MIENIVELRAELEFEAFGDGRLFAEDNIPVVEPRAVEVVPAEIAIAAERSKGKRSGGRSRLGFIRTRRNGWRADEVQARVNARMGRVARSEELIGQTGRESGNAGNLPAFEDPANEPVPEAGGPAPERNAIEIVDNQAMAGVDAGIATFLRVVERIHGKVSIADRGHDRIGSIIDQMRPGVRALRGQAVVEAFGGAHLQAMIDRSRAAGGREGVEESVVVDGIEGEPSTLEAEVEIAPLQGAQGAVESVWSGAQGHELGDESRLRGVEVLHAEEFGALGADVINLDLQITAQLMLHSKVPVLVIRRTETRAEEGGEDAGAVLQRRGRRLLGRNWCRGGNSTATGQERDVKEVLFEGGQAARKPQEIAEDAVMGHAIPGANGGPALFEGVPSDAETRLPIIEVIAIELRAGAWSGELEGEGRGARRIGQQDRDVVIHLVGNAIILVTGAVAKGEVGRNLVDILRKESELMLAETAQVRAQAVTLAVKELTLELAEDATMESPEEILYGRFRGRVRGIRFAA